MSAGHFARLLAGATAIRDTVGIIVNATQSLTDLPPGVCGPKELMEYCSTNAECKSCNCGSRRGGECDVEDGVCLCMPANSIAVRDTVGSIVNATQSLTDLPPCGKKELQEYCSSNAECKSCNCGNTRGGECDVEDGDCLCTSCPGDALPVDATPADAITVDAVPVGQWRECGCSSTRCCNPYYDDPPQYCPGQVQCQSCGTSRACECPSLEVV
jgi:hypothetical protein